MIKNVIPLFLLFSCSKITSLLDSRYDETFDKNLNSSELNIIFSNNINGETHPCGCRQHPLGGLAQVNGMISELNKKAPSIYVDTGDTFFPSTRHPESVKRSLRYTANKIAEALDMLKLRYFVPGDQDFAEGVDFLEKLSKKVKFKFLLTNAAKNNPIKHIKYDHIKYAGTDYIFMGLSSPDLIFPPHNKLFNNPTVALENAIQKVKNDFDKPQIILLSHLGIKEDKILAAKFDNIRIIIGSHDQAFLQKLDTENKAVIAQTLSRNHYLGKLTIKASSGTSYDYKLLEMRDEVANLISPNPFIGWLEKYKNELAKIQKEENTSFLGNESNKRIATYQSCQSCHDTQFAFWQKTAHSLAFKTLMDAKAIENPNCIGCHSVAHNMPGGFTSPKDMIVSEDKIDTDKYLKELAKTLNFKKSVRKLATSKRKLFQDKWLKLDEKFKVTHNYGNVQCLNCHDHDPSHPMDITEEKPPNDYVKKCIACHTADQSPSWYHKNDKGIATKPNLEYFQEKIKEVSCPSSL
jgi:hypothetical protein